MSIGLILNAIGIIFLSVLWVRIKKKSHQNFYAKPVNNRRFLKDRNESVWWESKLYLIPVSLWCYRIPLTSFIAIGGQCDSSIAQYPKFHYQSKGGTKNSVILQYSLILIQYFCKNIYTHILNWHQLQQPNILCCSQFTEKKNKIQPGQCG